MRKRYAVIISLILVLSIFCSISVCAADAGIQGSSQIAVTHAVAAWSKTIPGRMCVAYSITASTKMDKLGATKVEIYRYLNKQWEVEETVYVEDWPDMMDTDVGNCQVSIEYSTDYLNVPYKAIVYFYAEGPYGISTGTQYTNVI